MSLSTLILTALLLPGAPAASAPCDDLPPLEASATASTWNGLFVLDRAASDDLGEVAEQVAGQLPRRARRRAEDRLRERLEADECLRLSADTATVTIESERGVLWRVSPDGTAQTSRGRSAGRSLPATLSDSLITIAGSGERGQGKYELRRRPGNAGLELAVTLSAQRLESPIAYTLVYRPRAESHGAD